MRSMHLRNGEVSFTTNIPSGAMVATWRFRLTSGMDVALRWGRVPCFRCACTRHKSGQSHCVSTHAGRFVNGIDTVPSVTSVTDRVRTTDVSRQMYTPGNLSLGMLQGYGWHNRLEGWLNLLCVL